MCARFLEWREKGNGGKGTLSDVSTSNPRAPVERRDFFGNKMPLGDMPENDFATRSNASSVPFPREKKNDEDGFHFPRRD